MEKSSCKVCVTGGAGYIGSSLVKKLLDQGYIVHVTVRNFDDTTKVDPLKNLSGAKERLKLFEANIYRAEEFEPAIQGCQFVFHVATPILHTEGQKFKNRVDATVDAARRIADICIRSGTVRRLIYTGTVMAASPLKEVGSGYKEIADETCWTPLNNLPSAYSNDFVKEYTTAKTLAEKELLSFNNGGIGGIEVVSLNLGLVGGENVMPTIGVGTLLAPVSHNQDAYNSLKYVEELYAKIPVIHIEDTCNAHIFCMKEESMSGRFLCANSYVSTADIASYYKDKYPQYGVKIELWEDLKRETKWGSSLLIERGFEYKCDWKMALDDCINSARKNGFLEP